MTKLKDPEYIAGSNKWELPEGAVPGSSVLEIWYRKNNSPRFHTTLIELRTSGLTNPEKTAIDPDKLQAYIDTRVEKASADPTTVEWELFPI